MCNKRFLAVDIRSLILVRLLFQATQMLENLLFLMVLLDTRFVFSQACLQIVGFALFFSRTSYLVCFLSTGCEHFTYARSHQTLPDHISNTKRQTVRLSWIGFSFCCWKTTTGTPWQLGRFVITVCSLWFYVVVSGSGNASGLPSSRSGKAELGLLAH